MSKVAIFTVLYIASIIALLSPVRGQAVSEATTDNNVTFIGTVSCSRCQGIQPLHKGYTRWTWALRSVSEGDDIVLVVGNNMYKLQGDKDQLLKFMESKATVTGNLEGRTLTVQTIARRDKKHSIKGKTVPNFQTQSYAVLIPSIATVTVNMSTHST